MWTLGRRGVYHKLEALLSCRKLGNVVFSMCSSDVLLHRSVALLLYITWWSAGQLGKFIVLHSSECQGQAGLTPRHRFRQLEPSWFFNGQTTSLFESVAENELVKEDFGGMAWPRDLPIASRGRLQPSSKGKSEQQRQRVSVATV